MAHKLMSICLKIETALLARMIIHTLYLMLSTDAGDDCPYCRDCTEEPDYFDAMGL